MTDKPNEHLALFCPDEGVTDAVGSFLATVLQAPCILTLSGEIGAGKTTLIRAMLRALGVTGPIKSPTFALIEPYSLSAFSFYHVDLYRMESIEELEFLGLRDYLDEGAVLCIEWPEKGGERCPPPDLRLEFEILPSGRVLHFFAGSARGAKLLGQFKRLINNGPHGIEIR